MKTIVLVIALLIILKNSGIEIDRITDNYYKIYIKIFCAEVECSLTKEKS